MALKIFQMVYGGLALEGLQHIWSLECVKGGFMFGWSVSTRCFKKCFESLWDISKGSIAVRS